MNLTAEKQRTWNILKGICHPIVKEFYEKKPGKRIQYERIQRALNTEEVSFQPVRAKRKGPGFVAEYWYNGLNKIAEYHPRRVNTIPNAIREIEEDVSEFGYSVAWDKMTVAYRPVYTRYMQDIVLGADVFIEGVASKDKEKMRICYFYDNSKYEEGAGRWLILGKKKVRIGDANKVLSDEV
jgi:hypothetical protein